jgi:hypothetical protein
MSGSENERGNWTCWDFHEMRVRLTHYTIKNGDPEGRLKSWVVESSLEGEAWTEIDRRTNNDDFEAYGAASFAVSNSAESRFIRLAQRGKNHMGNDNLYTYAFEFFGTLLE